MKNTTKKLVVGALFAALSVILARLLSIAPNPSTRFSFETITLFLGGICLGPFYGALIGFVSDLAGSLLFSEYGFNPIYSISPILFGFCSGLFRAWFKKDIKLWKIIVAFIPPIAAVSVLMQSFVLAYANSNGEALWVAYTGFLSARSIQFAIIYAVDVILVALLCRTNVFYRMGYLPQWRKKDENRRTGD